MIMATDSHDDMLNLTNRSEASPEDRARFVMAKVA